MNRVGLYVRKAQKNGEDDIQFIINELDMYACEHCYTVVDRYMDNGVSGRKFLRPALDKMLSDCECGKLDGVLIFNISHLARDLSAFQKIRNRLKSYGVPLVVIENGNQINHLNTLFEIEKEVRRGAQRKHA